MSPSGRRSVPTSEAGSGSQGRPDRAERRSGVLDGQEQRSYQGDHARRGSETPARTGRRNGELPTSCLLLGGVGCAPATSQESPTGWATGPGFYLRSCPESQISGAWIKAGCDRPTSGQRAGQGDLRQGAGQVVVVEPRPYEGDRHGHGPVDVAQLHHHLQRRRAKVGWADLNRRRAGQPGNDLDDRRGVAMRLRCRGDGARHERDAAGGNPRRPRGTRAHRLIGSRCRRRGCVTGPDFRAPALEQQHPGIARLLWAAPRHSWRTCSTTNAGSTAAAAFPPSGGASATPTGAIAFVPSPASARYRRALRRPCAGPPRQPQASPPACALRAT
jgi:hypothetical protein